SFMGASPWVSPPASRRGARGSRASTTGCARSRRASSWSAAFASCGRRTVGWSAPPRISSRASAWRSSLRAAKRTPGSRRYAAEGRMAKKNPAAEAAIPASEAGPSFEEALARLETIVEELEGGALSLEQSIARYEEGVRLSRRLTETLDRAEKRIERLTQEGGEPATVPADLAESGEEAEPLPPRAPERAPARARAP